MTETATPRPADFDAYWDAVDRELDRYPARPTLDPMPLPSDEYSTVYAVRLTSIGPYRIFGYLSVPKGEGGFPGLLIAPGYGSGRHGDCRPWPPLGTFPEVRNTGPTAIRRAAPCT